MLALYGPSHLYPSALLFFFCFFNDTATTEIYTLSLHDALPIWLESLETWLARRAGSEENRAIPPMFTPFRLRDLKLSNRVVVSPMSMYSAVDGVPGDFHLVHYGARAQGGASLVLTEMTDVSADARITPGCAGLYTDEQMQAWKRIVDFVHKETPAKICLQLGHAGPKGSTRVPWEGTDAPLESGNCPL